MKKIHILFFLLFLFIKANAQFTGTVLDSKTKEPMALVDVYFPDLKTGTTTDEYGKFTIKHYKQKLIRLIISSLGYKTLDTTIDLSKTKEKTFYIEPEHYNLEEVVISAPTTKLQKNTIVSVIHKKLAEIAKMPSASLAESISNIAGVDQNTTGAGIGKPIIRGLSGNRIVTYAQGIRIENQQWGDEHGLGVGEIGIESVEVIKGPASLLYGADALGGVLYFVDERYAKHNTYEVGLQSKYVSNSLGYLNNASLKIHKGNFKFNLFGAYNTNADYQIPNGKRVDNTRFNEKNIKTSIGFNLDNWISNIRYSYLQNNFGITEDAIYTNNTSYQFKLPFQTIDNHNLSMKNKFTLPNESKLNAVFGFTSNYRREFEDDRDHPALGLLLNTFTYTVKWQSNTIKDIMDFNFGVQGMHQKNKNNGVDILIPDAITNDFGIYGLSNFKVNAFHFQTGIRFDNRKIDAKLTGTIPALQKNYQGITFSAGTVYTKNNYKFRANISNGFRAPNTSELLADGVHEGTNRYEKGNANLKNEQATQLDVSYDYLSEHFKFSINPFYNYIKNYIYLTPTNQVIDNVLVYDYVQKDAFLYGGEMGIHYHPHPIDWLHLATTLSTVFAEDTNKNALPLIPQSKINNSISAEFNSDRKIFIHKVFLQDVYKFKQPKIGLFETESKAYNLVNLGMSLKIKTKNNPINIDFGVKNAFNTEYVDHLSRFKKLGIPNPGRNYYISVKMNFVNKINSKN
jgi:iron complex outermembrane receptor protein